MQLVCFFFFFWKSHIEEKDVCVTARGLAQKSSGSSLHHHTQIKERGVLSAPGSKGHLISQ